MTKSTLQQQLETLSAARYPLHMPGHKRRVPPAPGLGCYAWDLTEIDGADDLHDADGSATAFASGFQVFDNGDAEKLQVAKDFLSYV